MEATFQLRASLAHVIRCPVGVRAAACVCGLLVAAGANAVAEPLAEELLYQGLTHSESLLRDLSVSFVSDEARFMPLPGDQPDQHYPVRKVSSGVFSASGRRFRMDVQTTEGITGRARYSEWRNDGEVLTWVSYGGSPATASQRDIKTAFVHLWSSDHETPEAMLFDPRRWISFQNQPASSLFRENPGIRELDVKPLGLQGDRCYRVTFRTSPEGSNVVLIVNASRGYLLQESTLGLPNGMRDIVDIELDSHNELVWYPRTIWERIYQPSGADGEEGLAVERRVTFSGLVMQPNLPSSTFTVPSETLSQLSKTNEARVADHR